MGGVRPLWPGHKKERFFAASLKKEQKKVERERERKGKESDNDIIDKTKDR